MRVVDGVESRARLFSVNKTRGIVSNAGRGFCVVLERKRRTAAFFGGDLFGENLCLDDVIHVVLIRKLRLHDSWAHVLNPFFLRIQLGLSQGRKFKR